MESRVCRKWLRHLMTGGAQASVAFTQQGTSLNRVTWSTHLSRSHAGSLLLWLSARLSPSCLKDHNSCQGRHLSFDVWSSQMMLFKTELLLLFPTKAVESAPLCINFIISPQDQPCSSYFQALYYRITHEIQGVYSFREVYQSVEGV